jgi:Ca-activated chloride channel family protein
VESAGKMHPPAKFNIMKGNIYLIALFVCLSGFRSSSNRSISGTIYDQDDKKTLSGVSVSLVGTKKFTKSNDQGYYSISVPEGETELVFSSIGYESKKVKIGKSKTIDVSLKPSLNQALTEVVVIRGYASEQKTFAPPSSAVANGQALQGRVAGLSITNRSRGKTKMLESTESYKEIIENQFNDPKSTPLSTFAIDVDAASYSNIRRYINMGQLPPKDAVRIEEMINYFNYDLSGPSNGDPVAIHTELSLAPWNVKHRLLRIGLKAKSIKTEQLPQSNLVFLIDVSGSMSDYNRLPLVQASLKMLVDQLRAVDRVAIVTYAGSAGISLSSTSGNEKNKIKEAIENLSAGGATAGGEGLKLAYQIAKDNFLRKGNNRIILASDGDFNVGASSDQDMENIVSKEQESGISLSALGFGMGNLKDSKMETIADKGHGNYAYIDNISEAKKAMVTEFGNTLFTIAKDVKLQIEFNPDKVHAYRLIGYENRLLSKEDFNNDKKIGGDMGVGHTVTALYEIIPTGQQDEFTKTVDPLKYQKAERSPGNGSLEMVTIKFRYKNPESKKSQMKQVSISDAPLSTNQTSNDFRFASSVAELGLLLRDSEYKQHSSFSSLIARAKAAKGNDNNGYRTEFISMAESARLLSRSKSNAQNK